MVSFQNAVLFPHPDEYLAVWGRFRATADRRQKLARAVGHRQDLRSTGLARFKSGFDVCGSIHNNFIKF